MSPSNLAASSFVTLVPTELISATMLASLIVPSPIFAANSTNVSKALGAPFTKLSIATPTSVEILVANERSAPSLDDVSTERLSTNESNPSILRAEPSPRIVVAEIDDAKISSSGLDGVPKSIS